MIEFIVCASRGGGWGGGDCVREVAKCRNYRRLVFEGPVHESVAIILAL